ncbi:hypothetical protein [Limnospira sp. PMC 917.15]|uniref:hypothetical protein n=1 Tax=Limnospira sp. PMC 917.15 TaxID=2981106 RepID=UPI0028E14459|nr:hypothetical protein [Limnospira sp. PMC 917.15]MDT9235229.1 hypothetical protein [Limnospira sp. PMC 917.15]
MSSSPQSQPLMRRNFGGIKKIMESAIALGEMWDNLRRSTELINLAMTRDSKCPDKEVKEILRRALKT